MASSAIAPSPEQPHHWTVAEILALPWDGKRHELIEGELLEVMQPARLHELVLSAINEALVVYIVGTGRRARVFGSHAPTVLAWDVMFVPDLHVVPSTELNVQDWRDVRTFLLVVEVLSPSTERYVRTRKRPWYQRAGVAELWLVDLEAQCVEVWHPNDVAPQITRDTLTWRVASDAPPLEIDVPTLLGRIG